MQTRKGNDKGKQRVTFLYLPLTRTYQTNRIINKFHCVRHFPTVTSLPQTNVCIFCIRRSFLGIWTWHMMCVNETLAGVILFIGFVPLNERCFCLVTYFKRLNIKKFLKASSYFHYNKIIQQQVCLRVFLCLCASIYNICLCAIPCMT